MLEEIWRYNKTMNKKSIVLYHFCFILDSFILDLFTIIEAVDDTL